MIAQVKAALSDLQASIKLAPLWGAIGWDQTRSRFQRTLLGPFWLSSGLLGMAFALSFVFGGLLGSDWTKTFEHVIYGVLAWSLMGAAIAEGANAFIVGAPMMMVQKLPLSFHVVLHMYRMVINYFCQFVVAVVLLIALGLFSIPSWTFLPAIVLVTINTFFLSFIVAFPATRFRDVSHMAGLAASVLFFLTPVFWPADKMTGVRRLLVDYNPLAHELELIRQPLMGVAPDPMHWIWSIGICIIGFITTVILLAMFRKRVIFWM
ncbi:ABC transporter permease [Caulobacter sp. LjRoot300]|uniref:ABC transporter permease n=1 Tax=Caulobacter sp. LjRoot300 TaxID=3342321 RepID=UPI003ECDB2A0